MNNTKEDITRVLTGLYKKDFNVRQIITPYILQNAEKEDLVDEGLIIQIVEKNLINILFDVMKHYRRSSNNYKRILDKECMTNYFPITRRED